MVDLGFPANTAGEESACIAGIPGTGEPGGLHLWGYTESDTTEAT